MSTIADSRRAAIESKSKKFFTGKPCRNGHVAERYTSTGGCVECLHPKFRESETNGPILLPIQVPLGAAMAADHNVIALFRERMLAYAPEAYKWAAAEWARRAAHITPAGGGTARVELIPERCNGATYEQFQANGWTDAQLITNGYARYVPDTPTG